VSYSLYFSHSQSTILHSYQRSEDTIPQPPCTLTVDNNILRCVRCRTCSGFLKVSSRVVSLHVFVSFYVVNIIMSTKCSTPYYQMNSCSTSESLKIMRFIFSWRFCVHGGRVVSRKQGPILSSLFLSCSNSLQVCLCTLSLFSCFLVNHFLFQSLLFTCASILFPSYPLILLARHFFFSARLLASCSVCITMPPPPSSANVRPKPLPPYLRP
jgi:hypothetical protein